ncbi:MAG TPA: rhodanese-like domain-containing protein [Candidatus Hydrogenedentes bacterium]|nr:rhodanese-like domain-containing protein [Candidatus Hydrogenedentota bacterium]HRK35968.1 rhodanese-like domain-containing protein [Candidatus Hydrogenedentota bacterium]
MKHHAPRFTELVSASRSRVQECTVSELEERIARGDSFYLVDVREESEFAAGHLPNAIHIGKGVIERDIESKIPDFGADIVLYCGGGYRSVLAAESIQKMGYTNVVSMDGGFRGWQDAGHVVVKP